MFAVIKLLFYKDEKIVSKRTDQLEFSSKAKIFHNDNSELCSLFYILLEATPVLHHLCKNGMALVVGSLCCRL